MVQDVVSLGPSSPNWSTDVIKFDHKDSKEINSKEINTHNNPIIPIPNCLHPISPDIARDKQSEKQIEVQNLNLNLNEDEKQNENQNDKKTTPANNPSIQSPITNSQETPKRPESMTLRYPGLERFLQSVNNYDDDHNGDNSNTASYHNQRKPGKGM